MTVVDTHLYAVGAHGVVVSNSKRISMLDTNALLSAGAVETLRDVGAVRGQKNDQYWLQVMNGHAPLPPKVPRVYEKFVAHLKGAGINVVAKGPQLHVMAMTNANVDQLAGPREVTVPETVHFNKDLRPIRGGLFDEQLTGGHGGTQWAAIKLPEPLPSPVFEEPIRRLLGLTQKTFESVISGDHALPGAGTGPGAIARALDRLDLDRELTKVKAQWASTTATARDEAKRKWGYLADAKRLGLHPRDWVLARAPVLPPVFRPVAVMGSGAVPLVSDPNYLYAELLHAVRNHDQMKGEVGEAGLGPERLAVYHAFKAVSGLGAPVHPKLVEKNVKGLLKTVFGSSPKFGMMQRKLLSHTVDNVGRAVITPEPAYDMDTVGLPEDQAFSVYSKFIVRDLKRRGLPVREALKHVTDRTALARDVLLKEMDRRPVWINRAPVLHKFGIMAFRPQLVRGSVMKVSPLIVKGFGADFDGDTMQFHVPATDEAVKEAYARGLPSKNLLAPGDFKSPVHAPAQEYLAGLFHATTATNGRRPRVFRHRADAVAAHARGDVGAGDPVEILDPTR